MLASAALRSSDETSVSEEPGSSGPLVDHQVALPFTVL